MAPPCLLRCQHSRVLPEGGKKLWDAVLGSVLLGHICFELPARRGRKARAAEQKLRAQSVRLDDRAGGHVEVMCLIASEVDALAGAKPVVWRLLTNREGPTLEAVVELVDWHRTRWEVEMLLLNLKQGCRVEALQLPSVERIERALAVYLVVSWRVGLLMRLGRACPDWDAERLLACRRPPDKDPHAARAALRMIHPLRRLPRAQGRRRAGE